MFWSPNRLKRNSPRKSFQFDPLLKAWINHLKNPFINGLGYLFSLIILSGLVVSLIKKEKTILLLLPVFLLSFIFLINATPPFNFLFAFLRNHSSLFKEALRFPFTKFSLILMFTYAIFFAYGLNWLYQIFGKFFKRKNLFLSFLALFIALLLIIFAWPMFNGQLIDKRLRIKIPEEYFEAQQWLNDQNKQGRILQLPLNTLWGWEYYNFGFQGAGFNWFGLKSPLLIRDFDRWNLKNEKAYQELSYALYSRDLMLFENLLDKYQIQWIWLDKNIIAPEQDSKALFFDETEKLFQSSSKIKITKEFNKVKIYSNELIHSGQYAELIDFENPPENLKKTALEKSFNYGQITRNNFGANPSQSYPFNFKNLKLKPELCGPAGENQVFGLNIINEKSFELKSENAAACIKLPLEKILKQRPVKDFLLEVDFEYEGEKPKFCLAKFGTEDCLLGLNEENRFFYQFPNNREIKNYEVRVILDKNGTSLIKNLIFKIYPAKKTLVEETVDNIDLSIKKTEYNSLREEKRDTFYFPELTHNQSYALFMEAENISGLPLRVCLTNYTSRRCDLYTNLKNGQNVLFVPISDKGGQGYDVNLSNLGIGPLQSINSLKSIKIIPLDYEFVSWETNPQEKIITNNQSYEKNWRAFGRQGLFNIKSLGRPIEVNGWMNGWVLKNNENYDQIVFFFLPQILEYFGFFLILILIVLLVIF